MPLVFQVSRGFAVKIRGGRVPTKESATARRVREFIEQKLPMDEVIDTAGLAAALGLMRGTVSRASNNLPDHRLLRPGKETWWGHRETIRRMREELT